MGRGKGVSTQAAPRRVSRYFLPLPILSVLLVVAVLALNVAGTAFLLFDDGDVRVSVRADEFVRRNPVQGFVSGEVAIANGHPFDILLLHLQLTVLSGTFDEATETFHADRPPVRLSLRVPVAGNALLIPAGATVTAPFTGTLSGDFLALRTESDFRLLGALQWAEVHPDGTLQRISRAIETVCVAPGTFFLEGTPGAASCRDL